MIHRNCGGVIDTDTGECVKCGEEVSELEVVDLVEFEEDEE